MLAGVPLHMALFVPPYSSLISLDKRVPFNGATSDLSWQQTVQRHWESLLEGKLSGMMLHFGMCLLYVILFILFKFLRGCWCFECNCSHTLLWMYPLDR